MAIEASKTIQSAYSADNLGETKPKIVIGGQVEKFVPNANFSFECESGGEKYFLNLNRKSVVVTDQKESLAADELSLKTGNETDLWHIDEKGRLKWDLEFSAKPSTNVFEWDLLYSPGLQFFYQPALTQEQIDRGMSRPEEVVGSYAVYCDRQHRIRDAAGKVLANYGTGKLLHIYRPLCLDAKGKKEWAELKIADGKLTVAIPQKFLDDATYPVTLDPTFGYETIGGSDYGSTFWAGRFIPVEDGTVTNIAVVIKGYPYTGNLNCGFYTGTTGDIQTHVAHGTSHSISTGASPAFYDTPVSGSITGSTPYWLVAQVNSSINFRFDSASGQYIAADLSVAYDNWGNDPTGGNYYNDYIGSIHLDYTTGGGGSSILRQMLMNH